MTTEDKPEYIMVGDRKLKVLGDLKITDEGDLKVSSRDVPYSYQGDKRPEIILNPIDRYGGFRMVNGHLSSGCHYCYQESPLTTNDKERSDA